MLIALVRSADSRPNALSFSPIRGGEGGTSARRGGAGASRLSAMLMGFVLLSWKTRDNAIRLSAQNMQKPPPQPS